VTLRQSPEVNVSLSDLTAEDLFAIGVSQAGAGDFLRAEQYLRVAQHRGYDEATVVFWLVQVCIAASRYQSALLHSSGYLRRHPADWTLRLVVASIHEALGDFSLAREELERIVRARPSEALPHYRLALLYEQQADGRERAKSHLREYLRLAPGGSHTAEARSQLEVSAILSTDHKLESEPALLVPSQGEGP
jgi:tetratricopeptide (TPR) repeat protein